MNPISRFVITYFIYLQIIYSAIAVMSWLKSPPETSFELIWLSLSTFLAFGGTLLHFLESKLLRNNSDAALRRLLKTVQFYPSLSKRELINTLTIQYPFVPAKVFYQAFEQAIAEKYISGEKA